MALPTCRLILCIALLLTAAGALAAESPVARRIEQLAARLDAQPHDQAARRELLVIHIVDRDDPKSARRYSSEVDDEVWRECVLLAARDMEELAADDLLLTARWYRGLAGKAKGAARIAMYRRSRGYFERYLEVAEESDDQRPTADASLRGVVGMINVLERSESRAKVEKTRQVSQTDPETELVLHWTFDDPDDAPSADEFVESPRGRAMVGPVVVADSAKLRHDGNYTLAAWVYMPNVEEPLVLVDKTSDTGRGGSQYHLFIRAPGREPATVAGIKGQAIAADSNLPTETWAHLVLTQRFDAGQTHVKFYRNGRPLGDAVPAPAPGKTLNSSAPLTIGARDVQLDDLRIYHRALSDSQVAALHRLDAMPEQQPGDEPSALPAPGLAADGPLWDEDDPQQTDSENAESSSSFFGIPVK